MEAPDKSSIEHRSFVTVEVPVGEMVIGGRQPVCIQSMATCHTMDTAACVDQAVRLFDAGCELVRFTAPDIRSAENLRNIRRQLNTMGYRGPLIADIHYTPSAAIVAARYVEKVRINPGNYTEKKKFDIRTFSTGEQEQALEKIREKLMPLLQVCRAEGTAIRIGTNHGSLSDRIMSIYGDSPEGMVMSALEFVSICQGEGFERIVLSMKSSNPVVMVAANRLLVKKMREKGMGYPLHLGVTEAGDGAEGRMKSAIGIGSLLAEGIGDTVRVSLTEDPWAEIPVAKEIVDYGRRAATGVLQENGTPAAGSGRVQRTSDVCRNIGGGKVAVVMADMSLFDTITKEDLKDIGYKYFAETDKWQIEPMAADYVYCHKTPPSFEPPAALSVVYEYKTWLDAGAPDRSCPMLTKADLMGKTLPRMHPELNFIYLLSEQLDDTFAKKLRQLKNAVLLIDTETKHGLAEQRLLFGKLRESGVTLPVIIGRAYDTGNPPSFGIKCGIDIGSLLLDGLGDGVFIAAEPKTALKEATSCAFGVLQATRRRITKTDYISCPSCGRTLFDLQETTALIKGETDHLKGVKIGIMGCIVNGPGEMADADYGYVGTGPGKITLYKGQEVVQRNIPEDRAVAALIQLIKDMGDWVDKEK